MFESNRGRVRHGVIGILTAMLLQAGMSLPAFAQEVHHFEIDTADAAVAIHEFGNQSGVQILASGEALRGIRLNRISGEYSTDAGFQQLLTGTGLSHRYVGDRAVALVSESAAAVAPEGAEPHGPAKRGFWDRFRLAQVDPTKTAGDGAVEKSAVVSELKDNTRLEEIIVSATKRDERLQDVPLSIAVVSAAEIDRRGLVNAEDYLRGIPGANQTEGRSGQTIVIRGIESATISQNFGSGPTTATYFGETPTTNAGGMGGDTNIDIKLVDIERVEVLRGPQGTAFGNSSMGGAVRTIPVAPKLGHFDGRVTANYSVTSGNGGDNYNVQAVGNFPLAHDRLALRATVYQFEDSGFYHNIAGSNLAFQAASVTPYGAQSFAIDQEEVGSYRVLGGRFAALFQASEDLKFTLSYLSQKGERDGIGVANTSSGSYEQTLLQVAPEHVFRGQTAGLSDTDIDIANAVMEYSLGWANLLATYSHSRSGSIQSFPYYSAGFNWPTSSSGDSDHREHVGEIRLVTQLEGRWNFLAGLYAENTKDVGLFDYVWHGDPATNVIAGSIGLRHVGRYDDRRTLKQKAAFGEASWELLQGLTLTGGARAYEYDRTYQLDADGSLFGGAAGLHAREDSKDSAANYRLNLSYALDDDALLYAGWSQGFRLGRAQVGLPPGHCDRNGDGIVDGTSTAIESTRRVDSDEVDSYEVGGKFALLERRLTIAADVFRMDWSGLPVRVRPGAVGSTCSTSYLANAGAAQSEGVELQANFQINEAFRVDVGGSRIRARLTEAVPALNVPKGNRLPASPEVNVNLGLQYELEIGGYEASLRADSIYVGPFYGNLRESPNTRSGDYVKVDVSARVAIRNLDIDLFVRNLTNEDAFNFRGDLAAVVESFGYRLRPRTIGLQLSYAFD